MQTKTKVIAAVLSLAISFSCGRCLSPTKIVTVTKTVTSTNTQTNEESNAKKNTKTTVVENDRPDGSKSIITTTTNISDINSSNSSKENETSDTSSRKTVQRTSSRLIISGMAGIPLSFGGTVTPVYGGHVYKEILGPVGLGAWYLSNNTGGLSIGVSF